MSTLKLALGSSFTAVADTMNGIGTTVKAVSKGANALNDYVDQMRFKQTEDYALERKAYKTLAEQKVGEKILREEENLNDFLSEREGRAEAFQKIILELRA
ncbi:hypothetical protein K7W03_07895 [Sphingobium sp. PNB]|uniref:hypothetical protein n=1 Tax=Sphingobium sp. PNB TaxID=863934 RepID=UPI001CA3FF08|nr:hypothetical protein [Sphingobium sp. PNB]MCB4859522.1 hypothetical protein [Sphingobium sp. PNB]